MRVRVRATRSTRLLWLLAVLAAGAAVLLERALGAGAPAEAPAAPPPDEVPFDVLYEGAPDGSEPAGGRGERPTERSAGTPK